MRSYASSTHGGDWSEASHAYPMPAPAAQLSGYYSRNGSLSAPGASGSSPTGSGLTPAQEYQAQIGGGGGGGGGSSSGSSPLPPTISELGTPPPPTYSPVPPSRPFQSTGPPSSFASARAQSLHARGGGPDGSSSSAAPAPLQLPAFENFGEDSGFNWDSAPASRRGSREAEAANGNDGPPGAVVVGGMITPRPGAMDDSELGYLAAGAGGGGATSSSASARGRVQSAASSVYSVDGYYSGNGPGTGGGGGPPSVGSRYSSAASVRSGHTRTPSESSARSGGGGGFARESAADARAWCPLAHIADWPPCPALARIDTSSSYHLPSDARSLASPSSGHHLVDSPLMSGGRPHPASHGSTGRDSVDSSRSLPSFYNGHGGYGGGGHGYANRSTSFSSQHSAGRDGGVASLRSGSIRSVGGSGSGGGGPNFPTPTSYNFPSPSGSTRTTATSGGGGGSGSIVRAARRPVRIYPALLSRVADAFRSGLTLTERVKDGLAYKDAFDGREAVDLLCALLDTDNRNLALLLGRALDFQKFFHDVTYDHRLRDSTNELYQFKGKVIVPNAPFAAALGGSAPAVGGTPDGSHGEDGSSSITDSLAASSLTSGAPSRSPSVFTSAGERSSISSLPTTVQHDPSASLPTSPGSVNHPSAAQQQLAAASAIQPQDGDDLPSGVFTLLSACYSPTCSATSLCYSISCPLRIEQAKKLNMKPQPGLRKVASAASLKDDDEEQADGGPGLWANGVSQAVLDSVGDEERKRQEAINELIFTERDFVKDMEYLRDVRSFRRASGPFKLFLIPPPLFRQTVLG